MANDLAIEPADERIDVKSVSVLLKPTLIDANSIAKAYRTRKSEFDTSRVHIADVSAQEAKGWKVVRPGKRYARMRRPKIISQRLEDRVWCLCKDMGYPVLNGDRFTVEFDRIDGSSGTKQIDILAKDDDTVVVVECKTRERRGRRSLQKDLHETSFLKRPIAQAIRHHFGGNFDPRII